MPINTATRFLPQLLAGEDIEHPRLGIELQTSSSPLVVLRVVPGTGADQGGLQAGDAISALDGVAIASFDDLAEYIDGKNVGDVIQVTVSRDGEERTLPVHARPLGHQLGPSGSRAAQRTGCEAGPFPFERCGLHWGRGARTTSAPRGGEFKWLKGNAASRPRCRFREPARPDRRRRSRPGSVCRWRRSIGLVASLVFVLAPGTNRPIFDDSYISLTYARNLAEIGKLSFDGETWSTGATSPLHVVIMAVPIALGINPFSVSLGVGILSHALLAAGVYLLGWAVFRSRLAAILRRFRDIDDGPGGARLRQRPGDEPVYGAGSAEYGVVFAGCFAAGTTAHRRADRAAGLDPARRGHHVAGDPDLPLDRPRRRRSAA